MGILVIYFAMTLFNIAASVAAAVDSHFPNVIVQTSLTERLRS